jgi:hypothetical protein
MIPMPIPTAKTSSGFLFVRGAMVRIVALWRAPWRQLLPPRMLSR